MAELLGTGTGAPMIVDTRSGDDGMFGSNPLLLLIALGLFAGNRGGLFGGGGDDSGLDCLGAQMQATTATAQVQTFQTLQALVENMGITNQLNNIQADQASIQANNDIKLLLTRLADGNIDISRQLCDCCCENKVLGLQNTAQIVGSVKDEGAATRALINQLDKENILSQLNDAKLQISNLNQTIAITAAIDAKLDQIFPPHFRCGDRDAA